MFLYYILTFFIKLYFLIFYKVRIKGMEKIPKHGSVILCSNHIHNLDPLLLASFINRQICYMAKDSIFKNKIVAWGLKTMGTFPVNRETTDITAIKNAMNVLKKEKAFGIFIEGKRSKTGDLQKAKNGTALIAIKSKSPVVPIGITGNYKLFSSLIVNIGDPIDLSSFQNKKVSNDELEIVSDLLLDKIKKLI